MMARHHGYLAIVLIEIAKRDGWWIQGPAIDGQNQDF